MEVKNTKKIASIAILSLLLIFVVIYQCYLLDNFLKYANILTSAVLILATYFAIVMLGYHKDKSTFLKKNVFKITIIQVLLYFCLIYAAGLVFGFLKNAYSLNPVMILNNILSPVIVVIASEILRYVIVSNNKENEFKDKAIIVLVTLVLMLIDISSQIRLDMFNSGIRIFKIVTSIILPSLAKNLMLTYLTYHVGYKTPLFYRLVMDLYIYLIPIFPDLGEFATSILGLVLPFFVYQYSSREIREYSNGKDVNYKINVFKPSDLLTIGFACILICLISGLFPLYLLGIASGSMSPEIKTGDAVLVSNININESNVNKDDVIVYEKDGIKVVHRVISKEKNENGVEIYHTKGDANNTEDNIDLTIDDIKGKVVVKIPFIGYPSVWFSELLNS